MHEDLRSNLIAGVLLVLICAAIVLWNQSADVSCEEQGGTIVWEVNMAASTSYGRCVIP